MKNMKKWKCGSYTAEAALLMGVLIPLLTGVIYLGFYLHEMAYMQNVVYESAADASLHKNEKNMAGRIETKIDKRLGGKVTGGNTDKEVRIDKKGVQVRICESWKTPGMFLSMFGKGFSGVKAETGMSLENPAQAILKMHGIKKWSKRGE